MSKNNGKKSVTNINNSDPQQLQKLHKILSVVASRYPGVSVQVHEILPDDSENLRFICNVKTIEGFICAVLCDQTNDNEPLPPIESVLISIRATYMLMGLIPADEIIPGAQNIVKETSQ